MIGMPMSITRGGFPHCAALHAGYNPSEIAPARNARIPYAGRRTAEGMP